MDLVVASYPILTFILLGLKRKPWFYGYADQNPKLKSAKTRFTLISLYCAHSFITIWYSTNLYIQMLAKQF